MPDPEFTLASLQRQLQQKLVPLVEAKAARIGKRLGVVEPQTTELITALGSCGAQALPVINTLIATENPLRVRAWALQGLTTMPTEYGLPALFKIATGHRQLSATAVELLAETGTSDAASYLVKLLGDTRHHPEVRQCIADRILPADPGEAVQAVLATGKDSDAPLLEPLLWNLKQHPDYSRVVKPAFDSLWRSQPQLRDALSEVGFEGGSVVLQSLRDRFQKDPSSVVGFSPSELKCLIENGTKRDQPMVEAIVVEASSGAPIDFGYLQPLAKLGGPSMFEPLREELENQFRNRDAFFRLEVVRAIALTNHPVSVAYLNSKGGDWQLNGLAVVVSRDHGAPIELADEATETLLQLVEADKPWAWLPLASSESALVVEPLIAALRGEKGEVAQEMSVHSLEWRSEAGHFKQPSEIRQQLVEAIAHCLEDPPGFGSTDTKDALAIMTRILTFVPGQESSKALHKLAFENTSDELRTAAMVGLAARGEVSALEPLLQAAKTSIAAIDTSDGVDVGDPVVRAASALACAQSLTSAGRVKAPTYTLPEDDRLNPDLFTRAMDGEVPRLALISALRAEVASTLRSDRGIDQPLL